MATTTSRIVYQTSTEQARQRATRLRAMRAIAAAPKPVDWRAYFWMGDEPTQKES
jgi:hypothetical protein